MKHSKVWFSSAIIIAVGTSAIGAQAGPRDPSTSARRVPRAVESKTPTHDDRPVSPAGSAPKRPSDSATRAKRNPTKVEQALPVGLESGVAVSWLAAGVQGLTPGKIVAARRVDRFGNIIYEVADANGETSEVHTKDIRVTDALPKQDNPFAAGAKFIDKTNYKSVWTALGKKPHNYLGAQVSWLEDERGARVRRFGVLLHSPWQGTSSQKYTIVDEHGDQKDIETRLTYEGNVRGMAVLAGRPDHADAPTAQSISGRWATWTDSSGKEQSGRVSSIAETFYDPKTKQYEHSYWISQAGRTYQTAKGTELKPE